MKHKLLLPILLLFFVNLSHAQTAAQKQADDDFIKRIYDTELTDGRSYEMLERLCYDVGHRLSGSAGADSAVQWAKAVMDTMGFDSVWLQPVMVPHWVRGEAEKASIISNGKETPVRLLALGGSVATPKAGITAEVIEVTSFEELAALDSSLVAGKIVFYNTPMDPRHIQTFHAYGACVKHRWAGATEAAKKGAVAAIVRSMTTYIDNHPHTGSMGYEEGVKQIPGAALSTIAAEELHRQLKQNKNVKFRLVMNCQTLPDKLSHNVIGEIRGSQFPEEIIVVGGHLDSWDVGHGAHDDGAGCVQSIESLRLLKLLGHQPKRTIRAVMFMNEENGVRGGKKYAELAEANNEKHIAAIESDRGGFTPRGWTVEAADTALQNLWEQRLLQYKPGWEKYGLHDLKKGFSGVDIRPLQSQGALLFGYLPDSQRYFYLHHAETDTFDQVNKRELELGAAAMASLLYLLSEYGVK